MANYSRPYFLIVSRPAGESVWAPQFGEHDRESAKAELCMMKADAARLSPRAERNTFKLIRCANASRAACDAAVATLNAAA